MIRTAYIPQAPDKHETSEKKGDYAMIRFFDMFSGVGGFRAGLERAGGYTCIGHCEIDKHADRAYRAAFNVKESEVFYEDATKINTETLPEFDLLCAGFPCQSFSIAGKRKGFQDPRGTMFFEIARVARERRPAYLLLENVPGLLSHDKGRTFAAILYTLHELGYHVEWQVLNSKDFGVPQSRRRVFIVGYLDPRCAGKVLPVRGANKKALMCLIDRKQDTRVYDPSGLSKTLLAKSGGPGGRYPRGKYKGIAQALICFCESLPEQNIWRNTFRTERRFLVTEDDVLEYEDDNP